MSDLQIVFAPDVRLRKVSSAVEELEFGEELDQHMNNMLSKMYEMGGSGLAGVQVGDMRRLLVIDAGAGPIKMVNPEIIERSEEVTPSNEGCLSLYNFSLLTERNEIVKVKYLSPLGEEVEREFELVEAIAVQHEIEHLDGITLLDKVSKLKRDIYTRKIKKLKKKIKRKVEASKRVYY